MSSPAPAVQGSPLAHRDFRVYMSGQALSLVGVWMQVFAHGWVVTRLTGDASTFGMLSFAAAIPMVLLSIPGGVFADRFDRRRILMLTQVLLALVALAYAALLWTDTITLAAVYLLAIAGAVVVAFDFPAQQGLVPRLVPPPLIPQAIALNAAVFHGSRFAGPALAGVLVAATSEASAFLANAVTYLAVIASLMMIKSPPRAAGAPTQSKGAFKEGLGYVAGQPLVRTLMTSTAVSTCFMLPIFAVFMPVIGREMYGTSEAELGMLMGATGAGALFGSLLLMRVPGGMRGKLIVVCAGVASLGAVALTLVGSPYAASAILLLFNTATALGFGLSSTIIQVLVPDALRGRVMGLYAITFMGLMPVAALGEGFLADAITLPTTMLLLAALNTLQIPMLLSARFWSLQAVEPPPAPAEEAPPTREAA